tara:strand:+ start:2627 stop:3274 length:648 start_codon:yes stop_codon:yes gene_type:complete
MYKNLLFDFDGVLAESLEIKTDAFYKMYFKYGVEVAGKVVDHHKKNGGMSRFQKFKYYHKNFLGKELTKNQLDELADLFSHLVVQDVINAKEVKGAANFLRKHLHLKKWVVSATPEVEIKLIVNKRGLENLFIDVFGSPRKKEDIVKSIIQKNNLEQGETVFIGDSVSDFIAAEKNNIAFILRKTFLNVDLFKNKEHIFAFENFVDFAKKFNLRV